ncbi:MAG TPA: FKBP-type peptidyl-prolyl cis-trans isomerase [Xanthomonadales bacterium]|nr:FKBP-type peptidyl-prolyl cis-trans isomerase [Xanthomonadales bacterium]
MFRNSAFVFAFILLLTSNTLADQTDPEFAMQDVREFVEAMGFVESRGLDISKGIESSSGLWRIVIEEGEGPKPRSRNSVTVHTTGWLADGTKFWSSHDGEGEALVNKVTGFVPGFTEGLRTMSAGGTSLFVLPGSLGYGPGGNPGAGIPPNATLIFEIELIAIEE